jgi:hypothetical protein
VGLPDPKEAPMPETTTYTCRHCDVPLVRNDSGAQRPWRSTGYAGPRSAWCAVADQHDPVCCPGLDRPCDQPSPSTGRELVAGGGTVGRLCAEHSAEAGELMAQARTRGER